MYNMPWIFPEGTGIIRTDRSQSVIKGHGRIPNYNKRGGTDVIRVILVLLSLLLCSLPALASAEEIPEEGILLSAADASFTSKKGISAENKKTETVYDGAAGLIMPLAQGAEVTFTVPEGVEGVYDVYLTISKIMAPFTSQPFSFRIAGGEEFSVPMQCLVSADTIAPYASSGEDTGVLTDKGRFPVKESVSLKAGDTIQVLASFGAKAASLKGMVFPGVGDLLLVPTGTPVTVGYDYVLPEQEAVNPEDALSGKTILWVGSSVTYGAHALGQYSMVDAVEDLHPALTCEKYAISATTLVNQSESSYVARLKLIPRDRTPDLIVVQLSTNDATTGKPFGEISESMDMADFDDTTIAGAIETIIAYARDTFGCPVVFYTGTFCEKENYAEMVALLHQIEEKWGIGVIDMFNNPEMTALYGTELYNEYMADEVHPTKKGYVEWWTPVIDAYLTSYMAGQGT